ncbi:MAG: hypothetical protein M1831_004410 [Alyxoria varia]|nr:MAG: hypothetical protein M1831_004410 [Alyxoria varia]
MSGQSQSENLYGFDYTNTATSGPAYAQSSSVPARYPYSNQQPQFTQARYGPIAQSEPRFPSHFLSQPSFAPQQSTVQYVQPHSRPLPSITSFSPSEGQPGTSITIYLNCLQDLSASPPLSYFVIFQDIRCMASVVSSRWALSGFEQELSVTAPAKELASQAETLPLSLVMEDAAGNSVGAQAFGHFTYNSTPGVSQFFVPSSVERTHQYVQDVSFSPGIGNRASRRRSVHPSSQSGPDQQHFTALGRPYQRQNTAYGPVPTPNITQRAPPFPEFGGGERESYPQRYAEHAPTYSTTEMTTPISRAQLSSHPRPEPFPDFARAPPVPTSQQNVHDTENPQLIRTSTLQQSQNPRHRALSNSQGFNPYRIYPNKAILKIEGDLDSVIEDWSDEENQAHRRLIEFERSQSGNRIRASFKPLTPEERTPGSICVSCIWWPGREEAVITSVDTIYLLESLVAVRFTVEEKNRIRRNLEGYKPMTVAKLRPESEEFFKIIMGFPNPKPRNIEKDVKVFPWKILKQALKKIIGKYTSTIAEPSRYAPVSMAYGAPLAKPQPLHNPYEDSSASYWFRPTQSTQPEQYAAPEPWQLDDLGRANMVSALPAESQSAHAPPPKQGKRPQQYAKRGYAPYDQDSPQQNQGAA